MVRKYYVNFLKGEIFVGEEVNAVKGLIGRAVR